MQSDLHMERHTMPSTTATVSGPADWNEALDIISYGSPEQVSSSSVQSIDYWLKLLIALFTVSSIQF